MLHRRDTGGCPKQTEYTTDESFTPAVCGYINWPPAPPVNTFWTRKCKKKSGYC